MKIQNCEKIMTVEQMRNRDAWLKIRTSGIGGSDAGTIMGSNPWKSQYQLWLEKTGQVEAEDISNKGPVYWGTKLEPLIALPPIPMMDMKDDGDRKRVETLLFEAEEYVQGNRAQATLFDDGK